MTEDVYINLIIVLCINILRLFIIYIGIEHQETIGYDNVTIRLLTKGTLQICSYSDNKSSNLNIFFIVGKALHCCKI